MGLIKDMLSHPTLSQTSESIQGVPIAEEENKSPDGSPFQKIFILQSLGILLALLAHLSRHS